MIDQFASRFGLDPDWVINNKSFDTVVDFMVKWKKEQLFQNRLLKFRKLTQ